MSDKMTVKELVEDSELADQETEAIFIITVKKEGYRYSGSAIIRGMGPVDVRLTKELFKQARRAMAKAGVRFSS